MYPLKINSLFRKKKHFLVLIIYNGDHIFFLLTKEKSDMNNLFHCPLTYRVFVGYRLGKQSSDLRALRYRISLHLILK